MKPCIMPKIHNAYITVKANHMPSRKEDVVHG